MGIPASNRILVALFELVSHHMGDASGNFGFDDLGLDRRFEKYFDAICIWAIDEHLITCRNADALQVGDSNTSYLSLQTPCLTSLGIAVGALALESMDGDIIMATAVLKNPGISKMIESQRSRSKKTP